MLVLMEVGCSYVVNICWVFELIVEVIEMLKLEFRYLIISVMLIFVLCWLILCLLDFIVIYLDIDFCIFVMDWFFSF